MFVSFKTLPLEATKPPARAAIVKPKRIAIAAIRELDMLIMADFALILNAYLGVVALEL